MIVAKGPTVRKASYSTCATNASAARLRGEQVGRTCVVMQPMAIKYSWSLKSVSRSS